MHEETDEIDNYSFRDDPIHVRLLDADEEFLVKELQNNLNRANNRQKNAVSASGSNTAVSSEAKNCGNKISSAILHKVTKDIQFGPICGWYDDSNIVYRKSVGPPKAKKNTGIANKEHGLSRDLKNKAQYSPGYIFRHYMDIKQYIEQYRLEHVSQDSIKSPVINELSDPRRVYPCHQYSPSVGYSNLHTCLQNQPVPLSHLEGSFIQSNDQQYKTKDKQTGAAGQDTARNERQRQTISAKLRSCKKSQAQYVTPSEASRTFHVLESPHSRSLMEQHVTGVRSAPISMVTGSSLHKPAAIVRKLNRNMKSPGIGSVLDVNLTSQFLGHKLGSSIEKQQPRVLESRTYNVGPGSDKQSSGVPERTGDPGAQLGPPHPVSKWNTRSEPGLSPLLGGKDWSRADTNENVLALQPQEASIDYADVYNNGMDTSSAGNADVYNIGIDTGNAGIACQKKILDRPAQRFSKPLGQKLFWKNGSIEANDNVKAQSAFHAIAKKEDERSLLSHNRRIKHLIEQSKLKCKYNQILGLSKGPTGKNVMEISNIQITDPFIQAAPNKRRNGNSNNCRQGVGCNILSHIHRSSESCQSEVNPNLNEIPLSRVQLPDKSSLDRLGEINYLAHSCKSNKSGQGGVGCQDGCGQSEDGQFQPGSQSFKHSHSSDDSSTSKPDNSHHKYNTGTDKSREEVRQSSPPKEGSNLSASINKCYIQKLAEEVAEIVKLTVPKLQYSKLPLVYRSQSMEL